MSAESEHAEEARALRDELETMRERAESAEARMAAVAGVARERLAELKFKEGFDAGVEHQKKAAPSPKAKQYRDERDILAGALRSLRDDLLDRLADTTSPGTRQTLAGQVDMARDALAKVTR